MPDGQLETSELKSHRRRPGGAAVRLEGHPFDAAALRGRGLSKFITAWSNALMQLKDFYGPLPRDASPATRAVIAALGDGPPENPDQDSRRVELSGAQLTAMATYLSLLPIPAIRPPRSPIFWPPGVRAWRPSVDRLCQLSQSRFGTSRSRSGARSPGTTRARVRLTFDLRKDIRNGPPLRQFETSETRYAIYPFSDLRRHDMGPELADDTHGHAAPAKPDGSSNVYRLGPNIPESYFWPARCVGPRRLSALT